MREHVDEVEVLQKQGTVLTMSLPTFNLELSVNKPPGIVDAFDQE